MPKYQIERIQALIAEIDEFNSHDIKDIEFTENGEPLVIPADVLEQWRFMGMTNKSFVEFEFWKPESRVIDEPHS